MTAPLVAVVTPVFNGDAYLAESIESVLAQTYSDWVLIVVDNASDDTTREIAGAYARRDPRISVVSYDEHVCMLQNWNRAMAHVPSSAIYVKQLHADDSLLPQCLELTVAAAESHPRCGLVSSYFEFGEKTLPDCSLTSTQVLSGRSVVRNVFLGGPDYLAAPSVLLLRHDAARTWPNLFRPAGFPPEHPSNPPLCQADKEGYFPIMASGDLVFIPKLLTRVRQAVGSATDFSERVAAWHVGRIELLLRHGNEFLDGDEYRRALRRSVIKYIRSLTYRYARGTAMNDIEFLRFQDLALAYLLPRLREDGHRLEASCLKPFAAAVKSRFRQNPERAADTP